MKLKILKCCCAIGNVRRVELRLHLRCGEPSDDKVAEEEINRPLQNVGVRETKYTPRDISLVIIFAALYAMLVVMFAPLSFYLWQVRIADALLPLSILFGGYCAAGLGLGCLIGNIYGWLMLGGVWGTIVLDAIGGSIANFVACIAAYWIGRRDGIFMRFIGTVAETAIIAAIVGGYLSIIFHVPFEIGVLGVLIGSLITINLIGFVVEEAIRKIMPHMTKRLRCSQNRGIR